MSEDKNKAIDKIKNNAPSALAWSRALLAGIPWIGGSLDHLIFDKAGEVRLKRLEQSVKNMEEMISKLDEERLKVEWFESVEALDMFKHLFNKIEFEPSDNKVKMLSQIYTLFGTKEHVDDPNKYAVLDTIAKLTSNQKVIFLASNEVGKEAKEYTTGDLVETTTAIWKSTILNHIKTTPRLMGQIKGNVVIDVELDIISSFNLLVNLNVSHPQDSAYLITGLGRLAYSYMKETE